jgi:hypothetical protein
VLAVTRRVDSSSLLLFLLDKLLAATGAGFVVASAVLLKENRLWIWCENLDTPLSRCINDNIESVPVQQGINSFGTLKGHSKNAHALQWEVKIFISRA